MHAKSLEDNYNFLYKYEVLYTVFQSFCFLPKCCCHLWHLIAINVKIISKQILHVNTVHISVLISVSLFTVYKYMVWKSMEFEVIWRLWECLVIVKHDWMARFHHAKCFGFLLTIFLVPYDTALRTFAKNTNIQTSRCAWETIKVSIQNNAHLLCHQPF